LSVDITIVIWTIISFIILFLVLKYLLVKPILKVMDERQAKIESGLQKERDAAAAQEAEEGRLANMLAEKDEQNRNMILEGQKADKQSSEEEIRKAQDAAADRLREYSQLLREKEPAAQAEAEQENASLADALAQKLLSGLACDKNQAGGA